MCFVLDANAIACLFDPSNKKHRNFMPLLKWLYKGKGTSLVIGGKTFRKEIGKMTQYHEYFMELDRSRRISNIRDSLVDAEEQRITVKVNSPKLNDAHIIALFCVSGCMLFASDDRKADPFVRKISLYPKGQKRPSIYRLAAHGSLLKNDKIVNLKNKI